MAIKASLNPFTHTPVVIIADNVLLVTAEMTVEHNIVTLSPGFKWKINEAIFENKDPVSFFIEPEKNGLKRTDILVGNSLWEIERIKGQPSGSIAVQPPTPKDKVLITEIHVIGNTFNVVSPGTVSTSIEKNAIFHILFEIDSQKNKKFTSTPLFNNAGGILVEGSFESFSENEYYIYIILKLKVHFPVRYKKVIFKQDKVVICYFSQRNDVESFNTVFFVVENLKDNVLELTTKPFTMTDQEGTSKTVDTNFEFLFLEK